MLRHAFWLAGLLLLGFCHSSRADSTTDYNKLLNDRQELQKRSEYLNAKAREAMAARQRVIEQRKAVAPLEQQRQNQTAPQVDVSRYDECPEGNSWYRCSHENIKRAWYASEEARLQRDFQKTLNAIVQQLEARQQAVQDSLNDLIQGANTVNEGSKELKRDLAKNTAAAKGTARLIYDETAPKTKFPAKVEKDLTDQIIRHEGLRSKAYQDTAKSKNWTVGYGTLLDSKEGSPFKVDDMWSKS